MIANRELSMNDYVAMLRRRAKVILIPTLLAPLAGYLVSRVFPARYTSQSLILVESQKVPETMVQPVVSEDLTERVVTLEQQVLSQSSLQPVVERLFPGRTSEQTDAAIADIRSHVSLEPVITELSAIGDTAGKPTRAGQSPVPGFYLKYTTSNPREAQQVCSELTTLFIDEDLKSIQAATNGTNEVLNRGIEDAKRNLDDMDAKLAAFKKQYVGQLPGEQDNNLKVLATLDTELEANTQTLNRAQQDKSYTESLLTQQLAMWNSSQESTNPETLQKQLSDLQSQLVQLQARYTDDHPDVVKLKANIAAVKQQLAQANKSLPAGDSGSQKTSANEPVEIRQLRLQAHQYDDAISVASQVQKRLQQQIALYQGRISLSPGVEEQYKELTRDYDGALKAYQELLLKKSTNDMTIKMNNQSEGERMFPLNPADFPGAPSFPNPLFFAAGGLGAGLAVGVTLALGLEISDKSIRNEADAEAVLELPTLASIPWVESNANGSGTDRTSWRRNKRQDVGKETLTA